MRRNSIQNLILSDRHSENPYVQLRSQKSEERSQKAMSSKEKEADKLLWKPQAGPQSEAFNSEADELLFGGSAGGGKAQPCYAIQWALQNIKSFTEVSRYCEIMSLVPQEIRDMDSRVLMWNGVWKSFSELRVGDRLMNPDGEAQEIIQIHERGDRQIYKIHFEDKTTVECDGEHLWGFWEARTDSRRKTRGGKKPVLDTDDATNWNINYISRARVRNTDWLFTEFQKDRRFIVPINARLNYTHVTRGEAARAYLYGALIGDGSIQGVRFSSGIRLYTADKHIKDRCLSLLEEEVGYRKCKNENHFDITFRDKWVHAWARNSGLLGKYSHEKFIPESYLRESLEFRWNLVQGLFDTDGYAASGIGKRKEVSYCTTSPQLAEDVANLVRSLGYMAKIREKQGVCYSKGYEGEKRMAYIVDVEGNNKWRLFSLSRKQEAAKIGEPNIWVGKAITNIEKLDTTYCRCITVSNPNGLYITDGYNVTHNSALLLILAARSHKRSIVFRRTYPRLTDLIERSRLLLNKVARYNSTAKLWRGIPGDRTLQFGAMQREEDKENYRGVEHDLKAFDELGEFTRTQYEFVITWNRTSHPGQRCRVVATCNPPSEEESMWIIQYWAAWLDENHPNPALPGEIRWYANLDGQETEVESGEPFEYTCNDGSKEVVTPRSRTFIPARLDDNAYLRDTNYRGALQRLPEPLRSQLLYGSFKTVKKKDHPWQVIPSEWYDAAVARWTANPPAPQSHLGVDVARGGDCFSVIAPRHHFWLGELIELPGSDTPDGDSLAREILKVMRSHHTEIRIDVLSVGSSPYDSLKRMGIEPIAVNGGASVGDTMDKSGVLQFFNLRSMIYWNIRELLDPKYDSKIALPPNPKLRQELLAPRWSVTKRRSQFGEIKVESKDEIIKRIGRSPDRADAVVYAFGEISSELGYEWMREL
jgi:hypothetical protein